MFRVISTALIFCLCSGPALSAVVYVYVNAQGNKLITDHPRTNLRGYKLLKKYGVDDYFGLPYEPTDSPLVPIRSQFDDLIFSKADKIGLEPALLKAMVHVESAFDADAISPKGAMGLMQLMPATAKRYGVKSRKDPVASLEGGGRYLLDLLYQFDQDLRLALAAYNAGENAVVKYNGIPPFAETQNYVERVIELRDKYRRNLVGA